MTLLDRYFDAAGTTLGEVAATQGEPLEAADAGHQVSQNLDGGAAERNDQLLRPYRDRTRLPW